MSEDIHSLSHMKWNCKYRKVFAPKFLRRSDRIREAWKHYLRSSEPEAEAEPPPPAARSVLDRLA